MHADFGKEVTAYKVYHYSDIVNRRGTIHKKAELDSMPELPNLKNFIEPIPFSKFSKKSTFDNISYSEELAGSIKTVYSSSDDERIDDFMSEAEMVEKVSNFLEDASIHTPTERDLLQSSMHDHSCSFINSQLDSVHSSERKKCKNQMSNTMVVSSNLKSFWSTSRSVSVQNKIKRRFDYSQQE